MRALNLRRFLYATLFITLGTSVLSEEVHAQQARDTQVKVALIYNFITFTEWPAERSLASTALTVCVSPNGPLYDDIQVLKTKTVRNQKIQIKSLSDASDPSGCDVIYVDSDMRSSWSSIKRKISGNSILTIAEMETTSNSSIISLALVDSRMAFDIDLSAAREAGLALSSKLLRLARRVQ